MNRQYEGWRVVEVMLQLTPADDLDTSRSTFGRTSRPPPVHSLAEGAPVTANWYNFHGGAPSQFSKSPFAASRAVPRRYTSMPARRKRSANETSGTSTFGDRSRRPAPLTSLCPRFAVAPTLPLLLRLLLLPGGGEPCHAAVVVSRRAGSASKRFRLDDRELDSGDDGDALRTELAGLDTASRDRLRCCHLVVVGSSTCG